MIRSPLDHTPAPRSPLSHPPNPACPLAALAREAETLIARKHACDRRSIDAATEAERAAAGREMDALGEALDRLAERAAGLRAASAEGALFALVLAAAEVETLDVFDTDPAPILARLAAHLWTLRGLLERDGALPDPVAQFWMPRHLEPRPAPPPSPAFRP
jgi:hypothetical protein